MSSQPMIEEAGKGDMYYLFVAKPGNHKYLMEWLNAFNSHPSIGQTGLTQPYSSKFNQ